MRGDTHARLTLALALVVGLVPVRAWQRDEIDTATLSVRLAVAMAVTWAALSVVKRVLEGYRPDGARPGSEPPRRRAEDRTGAPRHAPGDRDA